jgi:hypothetical protein
MGKQNYRSKGGTSASYIRKSKADRVVSNRVRHSQFQLEQGCQLERALAVSYLRQADGIGSGAEAAAALERGEHRR